LRDAADNLKDDSPLERPVLAAGGDGHDLPEYTPRALADTQVKHRPLEGKRSLSDRLEECTRPPAEAFCGFRPSRGLLPRPGHFRARARADLLPRVVVRGTLLGTAAAGQLPDLAN